MRKRAFLRARWKDIGRIFTGETGGGADPALKPAPALPSLAGGRRQQNLRDHQNPLVRRRAPLGPFRFFPPIAAAASQPQDRPAYVGRRLVYSGSIHPSRPPPGACDNRPTHSGRRFTSLRGAPRHRAAAVTRTNPAMLKRIPAHARRRAVSRSAPVEPSCLPPNKRCATDAAAAALTWARLTRSNGSGLASSSRTRRPGNVSSPIRDFLVPLQVGRTPFALVGGVRASASPPHDARQRRG